MTDRIAFMILALVVFSGCRSAKSESNANFSGFDLVDKTGNIRKPSGYRDHFQALGAYTVLKPSGNEMHAVYASPGAAEYYRKAGTFADGTVFGEGGLRNRSRSTDDRGRILGLANEGVVRPH
jgi:hypothetical protein